MTPPELTVAGTGCPLPKAGQDNGLDLLATLLRQRSPLPVLQSIQEATGDHFQAELGSFKTAFVTGPAAARQIMVQDRANFHWRHDRDPVTKLLRRGILVVDGPEHDKVRGLMEPALRRGAVLSHIDKMVQAVDWVVARWPENGRIDMLIEMRKIALIILLESLFGIDFRPVLKPLWGPIFDLLHYIGPGPWLIWSGWQGKKYAAGIAIMHDFLIAAIRERRATEPRGDMLDDLIAGGLGDESIRDQMLTMLIAGHDTATALLAWVFAAFSQHPEFLSRAAAESQHVLAQATPSGNHLKELPFLDTIIKETLRLFPPIHVSNRRAAADTTIGGYDIPEEGRVMYSIYLSHRHPDFWSQPNSFVPERFARENEAKRPAFVYLPFGGGPRNCIGAVFAQIEAKIVLARLLQQVRFEPLRSRFRPHMGATLEPRPGVPMKVSKIR